ncbi:endonuclease/exonuclease/phosphatase family metal-dependent hydrolase [Luteimonas cucumeris]|uniref:Endonuclease/exonuclease/phosphatase family metal-dependent hydrolase n=1 Tax=Luteimonas cucumeris TaxID=985012 RepID=A0A562LA65_9GAMM|nr:endonuclease/exonuclease/phosphatase family protein [Luteimonas cucumeris]TWI04557.1 endonuclease/exonuclease/phosphatase family metal-dependent hydrolase [Luteimonas cucumeris]
MRAAANIRKFSCRWLLTLVVLAAAVAACASPPSPSQPDISLVTLNLYHDKADWPKRLPLILAELKRLRPDVIALQEVLGHETLPNQAQTIADALGYRFVFSSTDPVDSPRRYGNALLTRHPILAQDWKKLEPLDDARTALHLRIAIGDRAINVYNTHLHWTDQGGAIRAQQVRGLLDFIAATSGDLPSVVAGDFNAVATAPELQPLSTDFIDAYGTLHPGAAADPASHGTLNLSYFAPKRIDHVFLQRDAFVPVEARIILDQADAAGTWPSDHYGLQVRFRQRAVNAVGTEPAIQ